MIHAKEKNNSFVEMERSMDSMLITDGEGETQMKYLEDPSDNQIVMHKEMLQSSASELRDLRFSAEYIDFAFTLHGSLSESKQVTLYNKFPFPVRVDWSLLPVFDKITGKSHSNPFNVRPVQQEISANGSF